MTVNVLPRLGTVAAGRLFTAEEVPAPVEEAFGNQLLSITQDGRRLALAIGRSCVHVGQGVGPADAAEGGLTYP